eukprot:128413_1
MAASDMILKLPEYIPLSVVDIVRLVNGYIRAKQNKHKISIPDDLINVLIRFAGGKDQWDITTMPLWTNILWSDQDTTIENQSYSGGFGNVYLSNIVKYGVHCWTFKILHIEQVAWSIIIGVYNKIDQQLIIETYPWIHKGTGYCYFVEDQAINDINTPFVTKPMISNALQYDTNDIITMTLDLNKRTINWKVNEKDICNQYAHAFENVIEGMYRAVVVMTQVRNKVKLVAYQQLK